MIPEYMYLGDGELKLHHEIKKNRICFSFDCSHDEVLQGSKLSEKRDFFYDFGGIEITPPHNDKLALVGILNTLPFAKKELRISWSVSQKFKDACNLISRVKIKFPKEVVQEPLQHLEERSSLCFSGGADSTAALCVMPKTSECVFLRRSKSGRKTLYDSDAAIESCNRLRTLGYKVHIVESDFEYLRDPVGFPTDLSVGTPAILLSDTRGYDSIAFGTILESAYGTSGSKFRDYEKSSHYRLWDGLFKSAGLGYSLPVAGVSEVASSIICKKHALGKIHQSCIRGKWAFPCNNCWKCYRKGAVLAAIDGEYFDYVGRIASSKEVIMKMMSGDLIKHEGVLTYALENSQSEETQEIELLKRILRVGEIETKWMEGWYAESKKFIHNRYRQEVMENLIFLLGSMDESGVSELKKWNNEYDGKRLRDIKKFRLALDNGIE